MTGTLPWAVVIAPELAHSQTPPPPPAPGAADISYFHYDHLGSPLMISDGNGAAVEKIRYNPYGAVRARFDGNDQPIGAPHEGPEFRGRRPGEPMLKGFASMMRASMVQSRR